jgi:hypothetical protein
MSLVIYLYNDPTQQGLLFKFCDLRSFANFSIKLAKLVKFTLGKQKFPAKKKKKNFLV